MLKVISCKLQMSANTAVKEKLHFCCTHTHQSIKLFCNILQQSLTSIKETCDTGFVTPFVEYHKRMFEGGAIYDHNLRMQI